MQHPPRTTLISSPLSHPSLKGYVVEPDGSKRLWVARRSRSKQTWPGKLDHIVAGGQVRAACAVISGVWCAAVRGV